MYQRYLYAYVVEQPQPSLRSLIFGTYANKSQRNDCGLELESATRSGLRAAEVTHTLRSGPKLSTTSDALETWGAKRETRQRARRIAEPTGCEANFT